MTISISITGSAPKDVQDLAANLDPAVLQHAAGKAVRGMLMEYYRGLDASRPNQVGGKRTHYYAQAARSIFYEVAGDEVTAHVSQIGLALHYYGGTVYPVNAKYLTIPIDPSAYGKSAREFDNLEMQFGLTRGGKPRPMFLVEKAGYKYKVAKNRKTGVKEVTGVSHTTAKLMYYLALSATIEGDESLLPSAELIDQAAMTAMTRQVTARRSTSEAR